MNFISGWENFYQTSYKENLDMETSSEKVHFSTVNYTVFGVMLGLSALIGVYFGFFAKKKQDNTVEYLLGSKKMNFFPIAASLIASHISGATFLAVPAEVYAFGSEYVLSVICAALVSGINSVTVSIIFNGNATAWLRAYLRLLTSILRFTTHVIVPVP